MSITISVIESNARRNGEAVINGVKVEANISLAGSDKQVAWATQIMIDALTETAKSGLRKAGCEMICNAAALDATVAKLNAAMASVATRLAGTSAAKWIDNRSMDAESILRAMLRA